MQQVSVFRDWWVAAEKRRKLGLIGRFAISFSKEALVEPGRRGDAKAVLLPLLTRIWSHALQTYGPHSLQHVVSFPPHLSAFYEQVDYQMGLLRADKHAFGYGVRTVLGKSIYWLPSYSFLTWLIERALAPGSDHPTQITDDALKCSLHFMKQRLAVGGAVLDAEASSMTSVGKVTGAQWSSATSAAPALTPDETQAALILRSISEHVITQAGIWEHTHSYVCVKRKVASGYNAHTHTHQ